MYLTVPNVLHTNDSKGHIQVHLALRLVIAKSICADTAGRHSGNLHAVFTKAILT